jgi:hypothetical protein
MMAGSTTFGIWISAVGYPAGFALGGLAAVTGLLAFLQVLRFRSQPVQNN